MAGTQCGKAAWYDLNGLTASGERADASELVAAHRTLPFGTRVRVENLSNGRSVLVRINDRGPYAGGRVIDMSRAAAEKLGYIKSGVARVRVIVIEGDGSALKESCGEAKPPVVEASLGVPEPRERPAGETPIEPAPTELLKYPPEPVPEAQPELTPRPAVPAEAAPPRAKATARKVVKAVDIPFPSATPKKDSLAQRFKDAFAPGETLIIDTFALGYAPADSR